MSAPLATAGMAGVSSASAREWALLRDAAARARMLGTAGETSFGVAPSGRLVGAGDSGADGELCWRDGRWLPPAGSLESPLLDLYLPVCTASPERPLVVGHLGQSLDGYIATASGDSDFVTGRENIIHLHRMRALCDAVVVGAGTVAADDPQLTTRLVDGESPVRVVLDPGFRLADRLGVFADRAAPTIVVVTEQAHDRRLAGGAEVLAVPADDGSFDLPALLRRLQDRGLCSFFVEGGGRTVSNFLDAGCLDRLQVAVAPMLTGRGRPGVRLPARAAIADCVRPAHRVFRMGSDILFDFDLRSEPDSGSGAEQAPLGRVI